MKFYDRTKELEALRKIEQLSATSAQMTVMTGRRRIGKTTLIKTAFTKIPFVYFFVGKKSETLLCAELAEIIRETLGEDLGDFSSFPRLLGAILSIAKRRNFTLVFDEFQNIAYTRPSIFSDIQDVWDSNRSSRTRRNRSTAGRPPGSRSVHSTSRPSRPSSLTIIPATPPRISCACTWSRAGSPNTSSN